MKHILPILTAALAFTAMTASAAVTYDHTDRYGNYSTSTAEYENYDVNMKAYENEHYQGTWGEYYTVKVKGNAKLYLANYLNHTGWYTGHTETLKAEGIKEFGYYFVNKPDDTGLHSINIDDATAEQFDYFTYREWDNSGHYEDKPFYREGYLLGEFKDGDEIQIWMSDGVSSVASNTPVLGEYTSRYNRGDKVDALDRNMPVAQLYLYGSNGNQINYGIIAVGTGDGGEGGGGGNVTFGSPLPGGLQIALIAGLFGLGFWYIRRRKAIAA